MNDYKEKYEQALENIKKIKDANKDNKSLVDFIEYEYPELKESEGERIRKALILHIKYKVSVISGWRKEELIAWLEKQEEQKTVSKTEPIIEGLTTEFQKQLSYLIASTMNKEYKYTKGYVEWVAQSLLGYAKNEQTSTNKVELKFKVDDWIYHERSGNTFHINKIENGLYVSDIGATISLGRQNDWRTWTIKDAKNGDVLSFNDGHGNNCIELIKSITDKKIEFWFCLTNGNYYEVFDGITPYTNLASREDATPATEEQRDKLEKAITAAGYKWDAEKKELREIEQKSLWSEEDESHIGRILSYLESFKAYNIPHIEPIKKEIDWLYSLKQRIKGE